MDEVKILMNQSKCKYILYDIPFELIIQETDDVANIKSYLRGIIADFEECSIEDMVLASKEYGIFEGEKILRFLGIDY